MNAARSDTLLLDLQRMHLQWFAAEDEGRTEDPTEHKLRKSREEGKVAKSQDVTGAVVILFTVVAIGLLSSFLLNTMAAMVTFYLERATEVDLATNQTLFQTFLGYFTRLTLPVAAVAFVAAVLGNMVQVGALFTLKPIQPDFSKIAPRLGKFLQRSFFSVEAVFNLAKSIGKVAIIAAISYINIRAELPLLANLVRTPFLQAFGAVARIAFTILVEVAVVMLVLAIFDYMFQRFQHREQLKMTKQEVKEERKTYEGDPQIKSRLKQRMRELSERNQMQNVPNADVVVTNPTHYSVAMEYKRFQMSAPTVIAKGADNIALRIREIATENEVPIIENRPLARALYNEVDIGDEIPEKYYEAVVAVLKQVYRMTGKRMEAV